MIYIELLVLFILLVTVIMGIIGFPMIILPFMAFMLMILYIQLLSYKNQRIKGSGSKIFYVYFSLGILFLSLSLSVLFYVGKFLRYIFL